MQRFTITGKMKKFPRGILEKECISSIKNVKKFFYVYTLYLLSDFLLLNCIYYLSITALFCIGILNNR